MLGLKLKGTGLRDPVPATSLIPTWNALGRRAPRSSLGPPAFRVPAALVFGLRSGQAQFEIHDLVLLIRGGRRQGLRVAERRAVAWCARLANSESG